MEKAQSGRFPKILPKIRDYYIDCRLKEFRKVINDKLYFIEFESVLGQKLLNEYFN